MKPHILQICSYYIGSRLYSELFQVLDREGYTQDVFIPVGKDSLLEANRVEDTDRLHLIYSKNFGTIDRVLHHRKVKKIYEDMVRKIDLAPVQIAHAHSLFVNGGAAYQLKKSHGIPYVVEVQNTDINVFFRYMIHYRGHGIRILEEADAIVFYSPAYRKAALENLVPAGKRTAMAEKSSVIGSGVHDFWYEHFGAPKTLEPDAPIRLVYVGMVDRNKNVETTIAACEALRAKGFEVELTVIGHITHPRYEELFSSKEFVRYIAHSPKEKLLEHVREADIFVMPSRFETFGLVYVEAMTQGLPIVYTRGQGFDEQEPDGVIGRAVTYNDAEGIARAILEIREDYERYSQNAIEVSKRFTWDSVAKQYGEIYRTVLHKGEIE